MVKASLRSPQRWFWAALQVKSYGSSGKVCGLKSRRRSGGILRYFSWFVWWQIPAASPMAAALEFPLAFNGDVFDLVGSTAVQEIHVRKLLSQKTGLTIYHAEMPGPVLDGAFCVRTEASDDQGCPHCLEHLVFLGSEDYPFRGTLDAVASRSLSRGTNAYTDVDSTVYTQTNAGSPGFLQTLPVFLDHILHPLLQDAAFLTEIHHVTPEGDDQGVVYSEMKGRENSAWSRIHRAMVRHLFAGTTYASETGGLLGELRGLTAETVRQYHARYYRPENLAVIAAGEVSLLQVLDSIRPVHAKMLSRPRDTPFVRPFLGQAIPSLGQSVRIHVEFPADDEASGAQVQIGWRGPSYSSFEERVALSVLFQYLSDSAVSDLQRNLVEVADPWCSDVHFGGSIQTICGETLQMMDVPVKKAEAVADEVARILRSASTSIDMSRLRTVLERNRIACLSRIEGEPRSLVTHECISDFLYGCSGSDFAAAFRTEQILEGFLLQQTFQTSDYWASLLDRYLAEAPRVVVVATPSVALVEEIRSAERELVQDRVKAWKPGTSETMRQRLEEALAANAKAGDIPSRLLEAFRIPSASTVNLFPVLQLTEGGFGAGVMLEEIPSSFQTAYILVDTMRLSPEQKTMVELLLDSLMELPVRLADGSVMSHEEVVTAWNAVALSHGCAVGFGGSSSFSVGAFGQLLVFSCKCIHENLDQMLTLLHRSLFSPIFDVDRLKISAQRLLLEIAQKRRDGWAVCSAELSRRIFAATSMQCSVSLLEQEDVLNNFLRRLDDDPQEVAQQLEEVRSALMGEYCFFACGPASLGIAEFSSFLHQNPAVAPAIACPFSSELARQPQLPGVEVVPMGSIDAGYAYWSLPSVAAFNHKDYPALLVACEYLSAMEGPLWRRIRGLGLAYGASISVSVEHGFLYLSLYRCSNVVEAVSQAAAVLSAGPAPDDSTAVETAKSSCIYSVIRLQETWQSAALQKLKTCLKRVERDFDLALIRALEAVSMQDIARVSTAYIQPLFSNGTGVITCPSAAADTVRAAVAELLQPKVSADDDAGSAT